ncbi:unnamed protein product [Phaedon cochleariae]|uniref:Uncharacterized protein n=1 Tax=Phaedon cochleariae TaxID=80249 RepID=A0A9N9SEV3_PHACE|nr:unnamed protein product [Phaedon cochleariae]
MTIHEILNAQLSVEIGSILYGPSAFPPLGRSKGDFQHASTKQSQSKAVTSRKPKAKNVNSQPPQTKKGEKPPPIIFDGILRDRKEIIPLIKSLTVKKFYFKYGNESTLLYTESTEDFENVKRRLKEDEVSFYTYALKKDKTHAFVLRGLDFEPEPSEIIEEMEQEHKIKVKEVYRLNTRYRPLYLATRCNSLSGAYGCMVVLGINPLFVKYHPQSKGFLVLPSHA